MAEQIKNLHTEILKVLDYTAAKKNCARNRALVTTTYLSSMLAGEVPSLMYNGSVVTEGHIPNKIRLSVDKTIEK
jgi:hypothetical protein